MAHCAKYGTMSVNAVHSVRSDGRILLPKNIREKYIGEHMAIVEKEPGVLVLEMVEVGD